MENIDKSILFKAIMASIKAGKAILEVYNTEFDVEFKDDNSPLTIADKRSHEVISKTLESYSIPVLSEEGKEVPFEVRKDWSKFWCVDPLDGTKEFIKRNGEFTVNIALMEGSKPVFGIIYVPVHNELYFGGQDFGSFKLSDVDEINGDLDSLMGQSTNLPINRSTNDYVMIGSRSHMSNETKAYFEKKKQEKGDVNILSRGSSLKLCMVAEGQADEYPRFAPTMEWDVAAGQAIIEGSGGEVLHYKSGEIMHYNRENLVNSWFLAKARKS